MRTILPDDVDLEIRSLPDGKMKFRYREFFRQESYSGVDDGVSMTRAELLESTKNVVVRSGLEVETGDDWIELRCVGNRNQIANMIIGEWLCWSTLGNMSLRDILVSAVAA